jgi:hypothetical protein
MVRDSNFLKRFEISREQQVVVVLHPARHAENLLVDKECAHLLFINFFGFNLRVRIGKDRRRR